MPVYSDNLFRDIMRARLVIHDTWIPDTGWVSTTSTTKTEMYFSSWTKNLWWLRTEYGLRPYRVLLPYRLLLRTDGATAYAHIRVWIEDGDPLDGWGKGGVVDSPLYSTTSTTGEIFYGVMEVPSDWVLALTKAFWAVRILGYTSDANYAAYARLRSLDVVVILR